MLSDAVRKQWAIVEMETRPIVMMFSEGKFPVPRKKWGKKLQGPTTEKRRF